MKINEKYRVEHNQAGGFNLFVKSDAISKKTGKPVTSERSYFYPNLEMIAKRMIENDYPTESRSIQQVADNINKNAKDIGDKLAKLMRQSSK